MCDLKFVFVRVDINEDNEEEANNDLSFPCICGEIYDMYEKN